MNVIIYCRRTDDNGMELIYIINLSRTIFICLVQKALHTLEINQKRTNKFSQWWALWLPVPGAHGRFTVMATIPRIHPKAACSDYNQINNWTNVRAERIRARQLRARFTATFLLNLITQCAFNSCSFNYKSDYSMLRAVISWACNPCPHAIIQNGYIRSEKYLRDCDIHCRMRYPYNIQWMD